MGKPLGRKVSRGPVRHGAVPAAGSRGCGPHREPDFGFVNGKPEPSAGP